MELSATGAAATPVHCSQPSQWKPLPSLLFHEHFGSGPSFQSPAYVWHSFSHVAYSPSIKELRIQGWTGPN